MAGACCDSNQLRHQSDLVLRQVRPRTSRLAPVKNNLEQVSVHLIMRATNFRCYPLPKVERSHYTYKLESTDFNTVTTTHDDSNVYLWAVAITGVSASPPLVTVSWERAADVRTVRWRSSRQRGRCVQQVVQTTHRAVVGRRRNSKHLWWTTTHTKYIL